MDQDQAKPKRGEAKRYDEQFKRSVVEHWLSSGQSAVKIAKEFGVNAWNLRDWKRRYAPPPKGAEDPVPESPAEMKREIEQLRKELARTIHQREILKKLWASFRRYRGPLSNDPGTFQRRAGPSAVSIAGSGAQRLLRLAQGQGEQTGG